MVKRISTLSGKVRTRPLSRLDSDRYLFLDLSQAEPNPGLPPFDGAVFVSNVDGTRSWTSSPSLRGLNFQTGTLDSVGPNDFYILGIKGDPFDASEDSVGVRRINLSEITETDTLDTVTTRGNTTANSVTVGQLTADSALFNYNVVITGNLTVNGTTTTLNTQDLIVEDKNILIAYGAANAAAADSAGITVAGANARILYRSDSDAWKFNKVGVFERGIKTLDPSQLDSTTITKYLYLLDVPETVSTVGLFLDPVTGLVSKKTVTAVPTVATELQVVSTNNNNTFYPTFVGATSGYDSVNVDTNLTYNASTNRLTLGKLSLTQLIEQPNATYVLSITSDSVGFRNVSTLITEYDTLDTVTTRGNTTTNDIVVGKVTGDSAVFNNNLTVNGITNLDSTTIDGYLVLNSVPITTTTNEGLFIEPSGLVVQKTVSPSVFSGVAEQVQITDTDSNITFYPLFATQSSGDDSVRVDTDLTYNAFTNRLTSGRLSLTQLMEQPSAAYVLSITSDSVGYRSVSSLFTETDTLDTVTSRGNTTANSVTVGNLNAGITALDSTTVTGSIKFTYRLLDNANRALIIYDSTGAVLWGA